MHLARERRRGDPLAEPIPQSERAIPSGPNHPDWQEEPNYDAWHQRLRKMKGSASAHECSGGCGRQAKQWAYVGPRTAEERQPFRVDPDLYAAMCIPCHKQHDMDLINSHQVTDD